MKNGRLVIGFIRSGVHPDHVLAYKNILEDRAEVFGVCEDLKEWKEYDKKIKAYCLEKWLKTNWTRFTEEKLKKYQNKYKEWNLWELYYTDRYARFKYDGEDASRLLVGMISFWEFIIKDSGMDCIVSDCIIGAENFISMMVGKKYGVPYISTQTARYKRFHTYFSIDDGHAAVEYKRLIESGYEPSSQEIAVAEDYINGYIKEKKQPFYVREARNNSRNLADTLCIYLKGFRKVSYLWDKRFDNKYDIHLYKGRRQKLAPLEEALRRPLINRYLDKPDYSEDYVLFPLHFQPEASTCVYARKYENQLFFIEQLAKSIPAGIKLYVKEHSVRQGHRPLSFYREAGKFPNVRLIRADADSHELIRKSLFIVCLTSTMGFEALMYGKPVYVCGDCFYEDFSGVIKIHDVFDEKDKFKSLPVQNRNLYLKQMAIFLKTVHFCSYEEEPLHEGKPRELRELQENSMMALLEFIDRLQHLSINGMTTAG